MRWMRFRMLYALLFLWLWLWLWLCYSPLCLQIPQNCEMIANDMGARCSFGVHRCSTLTMFFSWKWYLRFFVCRCTNAIQLILSCRYQMYEICSQNWVYYRQKYPIIRFFWMFASEFLDFFPGSFGVCAFISILSVFFSLVCATFHCSMCNTQRLFMRCVILVEKWAKFSSFWG